MFSYYKICPVVLYHLEISEMATKKSHLSFLTFRVSYNICYFNILNQPEPMYQD